MKIYLRPVTIDDGKKIVKWRNNSNIQNHCFDKTIITEESNRVFFENFILTGKYKQFIVERIDDEQGVASYSIATIYLKDIDNINHRCELCIFTSDDQEWNTVSQTLAIKQMLEKAFSDYRMHKIYSYVFCQNTDEVALLENSGFKIEAKLENEALDITGKYQSVYRMCIFTQMHIEQ